MILKDLIKHNKLNKARQNKQKKCKKTMTKKKATKTYKNTKKQNHLKRATEKRSQLIYVERICFQQEFRDDRNSPRRRLNKLAVLG